jgi:hypothetical protein
MFSHDRRFVSDEREAKNTSSDLSDDVPKYQK